MGLRDYNNKHTLKRAEFGFFFAYPFRNLVLQLILEMPCCESVTYSTVGRRDLLRPQFWRIPFPEVLLGVGVEKTLVFRHLEDVAGIRGNWRQHRYNMQQTKLGPKVLR